MKARPLHLAIALAVAGLLAASVLLPGPGPRDAAPAPFIIATRVPEAQAELDGTITALVAIGYAGAEPTWLLDPPGLDVTLTDAAGNPVVPNHPVETPGPPPPDHYVERDGRRHYLQPVLRFGPDQGSAKVIRMDLTRFRMRGPGRYTLTGHAYLGTLGEADVIERDEEGLSHRLWTAPDGRPTRFHLVSDPIEVEVR